MVIQYSTSEDGRVYLADFRVALGELLPLDQLTDADVVKNLDNLRKWGMTGAAVTAEHTITLATRVLNDGDLPDDIAYVLYATQDLAGVWPPDLLVSLLVSAGRLTTPGLIVSGNGCANFGSAVQAAVGLCRGAASVVVVTADRAPPGQRVLPDMTLLGDAAASCTVTTELTGPGFELVAVLPATRFAPPGGVPAAAGLRATFDGVREVTRGALALAGWESDDIAGMLVGEYSPTALRALASGSGVKNQIDWVRERAGHCQSADLVRGLDSLLKEGRMTDGDRLLALSSGNNMWTMLALRYTVGPQ